MSFGQAGIISLKTGSEKNDLSNLHPLVAAYIKGEKFADILVERPELKTPLVDATMAVSRAMAGDGSDEEAYRIAAGTDLTQDDPQLVLIFMGLWVNLIMQMDRIHKADHIHLVPTLSRQMESLLPENCHEILRLFVLAKESSLAMLSGDRLKRERTLKEILALCSYEHREYWHAAQNYVLCLAELGRLSECGELLARLENSKWNRGVPLARLLQYAEAGHYDRARELLPRVEQDPILAVSADLRFYRTLLDLMHSRWGRPCCEEPPPSGLPAWAISTEELLARRPRQALAAMRSEAEGDVGKALSTVNFDSFSLIRAELACGHGEAAHRLIEMRRERGNVHMMDDFFLARTALLAGDFGGATRHFAAVSRACDRYDRRPALDFELRLSCELAPGDLLRLAQAAAPISIDTLPAADMPKPAPAAPLGLARLVGQSASMESVRTQIRQLAPLEVPVLITGETGTGKDKVAEAIHQRSSRAGHPFIKINCGALPEPLLESELFGYVKGAFTGAVKDKPGMFRLAQGGTLFLTEIGDMPLPLQVKLLSVLDDREFFPLGGEKKIKVDVRIIAATHRPLKQRVAAGEFREDLYYRLNVLHLHLPPLRERETDTRFLLNHFLRTFAERTGAEVKTFSAEALHLLLAYPFPGNIRELRNIVEYCINICQEPHIEVESLPKYLFSRIAPPAVAASEQPETAPPPPAPPETGKNWLTIEKELVINVLTKTRGNRSKAADILGWGRTTLWRKLKLHGLMAARAKDVTDEPTS